MFNFKKNKELQEQPLNYWEEQSYFLVLPNDEEKYLMEEAMKNLHQSKEFKVIDEHFNMEEGSFLLKIDYDNTEYEIGLYESIFNFSPFFVTKSYHFTETELKKMQNTHKALTIFMKFNGDAQKNYHFQLKLAVTLIPDLIAVLDESAERFLPPLWVKMAANSKVVPSTDDLFTVQAVKGKNNEIWLHTHGLCRFGLTELEVMDSNDENYESHYNLITALAGYLLDNRNINILYDSVYIGLLQNNNPIVVTCRPWIYGLDEYKNCKVGNVADRQNGHNSKTSIIFLYKSEEDEKMRKISKLSIYDELWSKNPLYFISDKETERMKTLARERFDFVKEAFKDKNNQIIIKIGLPVDTKDNYEHIWFILLEFKGDKFRAKLTQEPYDVKNMHTGDEGWYTVDDVTSWQIYTPKFIVTPENSYLLIK